MSDDIIRKLAPHDWSSTVRDLLAPYTASNESTLNILRIYAHHESALASLTKAFDTPHLPLKDREAVVVRALSLSKNEYELFYHQRMFLAWGGTEEELALLKSDNPTFKEDSPEHQRLSILWRVCGELSYKKKACEDTLRLLRERYDEAQVIEIIVAFGTYSTVSLVANSLEVEIEGDAELIASDIVSGNMGVTQRWQASAPVTGDKSPTQS